MTLLDKTTTAIQFGKLIKENNELRAKLGTIRKEFEDRQDKVFNIYRTSIRIECGDEPNGKLITEFEDTVKLLSDEESDMLNKLLMLSDY